MGRLVENAALPEKLSLQQAVEAAYPVELDRCQQALQRGLGVLVECDKELAPYLYRSLRQRLRQDGVACEYIDGRPRGADDDPTHTALVGAILRQLRDAVRGPAGGRVVVLPHLDVLTAGTGGALTAEAREVIPLLYESPDILWLGFEDPSFPVPGTIQRLFAHRERVFGVRRGQLAQLVTQQEALALGGPLDTHQLYKCVSGVNAVRLRRVLAAIASRGTEGGPDRAYAELRSFTLNGRLSVPAVDLRRDIGGYDEIKARIEEEIVDVVRRKDAMSDERELARVEELMPRGLILWGPPGTGKTLLAQALASAIGAAVLVESCSELRTRWVLESTESIRQVFAAARRSAPSVLVLDDLDSFAGARGGNGGGVEHAMLKQLMAEMDALRADELVFVVGTTRHVQVIEPTLRRPGRFEFHLNVPYPGDEDRRAILRLHDERLELQLTDEALEHTVRSTSGIVEGTGDARYSGDHLQALARQLARRRLRLGLTGPTRVEDVDAALEAYLERPALSPAEEVVVATHEAGHAVCAANCPHTPPIERISIRGDLGALGYVRYESVQHRYVTTRNQVLDIICSLFGGREAEALLLDDVSAGAGQDIDRATVLARHLVERLGMAGDELASRTYREGDGDEARLAEHTRAALDTAVGAILHEQRRRARAILQENRAALESLRDLLLKHKVLVASTIPVLGAAVASPPAAPALPRKPRAARKPRTETKLTTAGKTRRRRSSPQAS